MPIYEYQPLKDDGTPVSWEEASDRRCCFFEFLSLFNEQQFEKCPNCGGTVGRAPSRFAARVGDREHRADALGADLKVSRRTVDALRAEGLSDFAEAFAEARKGRGQNGTGAAQAEVPAFGRAPDQGPAPAAVRELLTGHVCTAECKH